MLLIKIFDPRSSGDVTSANILQFHSNTSLRAKQTLINGQLTAVMRGIYASDGRLTRLTRLDLLDGRDSLVEFYLIDRLSENGDLAAARQFSPDAQFMGSFSNVFDVFTRVSARNYDTSGNLIYQYTVYVNAQKWPMRTIASTLSGNQMLSDTTDYAYDSLNNYGNWGVRKISKGGKLKARHQRTYTYGEK